MVIDARGQSTTRWRLVAALASALLPLWQAAATAGEQEVLLKLCKTSPCEGPFARVELLRDAKQRLVKLRFRGDFRTCTHPPAVYFDPSGRELSRIDDWLRSDGDAALRAKAFHEQQTQGLVVAEVVHCLKFMSRDEVDRRLRQ